MFDLNSLLTVREKIYMQDSELGSQVPLISSDGPRHGILPLEYGMRGRQLSASTCNSASEYSSLWFSFSPLLSFLLFLSEPDILKGLGFYSVLFCYFFSSKKKEKMIWFSISYFSSSTLWTQNYFGLMGMSIPSAGKEEKCGLGKRNDCACWYIECIVVVKLYLTIV